MSESGVKEPLVAFNDQQTIIVKKNKKEMHKEKLFNLGSKLFLVFNILTVAYTLLYVGGCIFRYFYLLWKLPKEIKSAVKVVLSKDNESKLRQVLRQRAHLQQQIDYFNHYLTYYRWKSVGYFLKEHVYGNIKSFVKLLNPILLFRLLFKYVIYGLPKEIITNLFFRINNFYYLALTFHLLAIGSLIHFQKFQQRTLKVLSIMSNYDAMSVNYLQLIVLAVLAILSTPTFVKLVPFMTISLASILKDEQQKKVVKFIPWTFIGSIVPYLVITLLLGNGEGFFFLLYAMIIVLKCKFNKFDNLILLKIVYFLDVKITKKFEKSDGKDNEENELKLKRWSDIKRSIVAETATST